MSDVSWLIIGFNFNSVYLITPFTKLLLLFIIIIIIIIIIIWYPMSDVQCRMFGFWCQLSEMMSYFMSDFSSHFLYEFFSDFLPNFLSDFLFDLI